ncbi:MAG: Gfo/Idh/MocA family oxidoreductase [Hyphomicrobiales bacterium]|jgi:predicted dehydrogenase|nr:Gfo/Idh/MocA family oxidoreductase [Hyphomicrobiales bacterium]
MSRLRIAIIGLGAAVEPHAKALVDLREQIDVAAAVTRNRERAAAFGARFPFKVSTDVDGVITDPAIDAILLLTTPDSHLQLAGRCFAAGKHVLVEKPLAITLAGATALVENADRAGRTLGVVLQNRFRPAVLRLHELLRAGELGAVVHASMQVPWWRPQSYYDEPGRGTLWRDGGGVLITQAIHTLDIFRSLVGVSIVEAACVTTTPLHRMEGEDLVTALVRLGNGAPGSIMATTAAYPGAPESISILGTLARAELTGASLNVTWLDGRREATGTESRSGTGAAVMDFPHDTHRALIADFASAAREGRHPLVTGEDCLATQRIIDAVIRAGSHGGSSVPSVAVAPRGPP